ncbi:hypothetical protein HX773_12795 [Pantoea sp. B9002]|uniref:capsular polysaccharide synthesis protein n=1 Tax=Pantoea sp. B9002 TaxID=2726979 RepID=UPI0015A18A69|nr:hypothetical protein [Pantoea sp. B9002]
MIVYTYWVDLPGKTKPAYLNLCMKSWENNIPNLEIKIINHENIYDFIPKKILPPIFFQFSLAMQSDMVSAWVLTMLGGIFIDTDTIITKNISDMTSLKGDKLYAFGYQASQAIHLAVLSANKRNKLTAAWFMGIIERLNNIPGEVSWDYVGNGILGPLIKSGEYDDCLHILDAVEEGNILEARQPEQEPWERYLSYYFMPKSRKDFSRELEKCKCGIISLHNSWTPEVFRDFSEEKIKSMKNDYLLPYILMEANS